jgi:hypothetical protein
MGYLAELFSSGSVFMGVTGSFISIFCYVSAHLIVNQQGRFRQYRFHLLFGFIIGFYVIYAPIMMTFEFVSIKYFSFGIYQKPYETLMQFKHPNGLNIMHIMSRIFRNSNGIMGYIFLCWFPFCIKYTANHFNQLQEIEESQKEKKLFEQKLLKAQLKQDFIDTVLKQISEKIHTENDLAQVLILKLSNTTRYTLYGTDANSVPLQHELDFLLNYFDLKESQLLDNKQVVFKLKAENIEQNQISPLILFPFFDEAFRLFKDFLRADLSVLNNQLNLNIEIDQRFNLNNEELQNVTKRLAIYYKNQHELNIIEGKIDLSIMLSDSTGSLGSI